MTPNSDAKATDRKGWMSVLAKASPARLSVLMPVLPAFDVVRQAEVGSVMVQGRVGGTGAAFNLGEMTVTRCSVRLAGGTVGHAYVQGRDKGHAIRAAVVDALMQTDAADQLSKAILAPLAAEALTARMERAGKSAATKVDFFTMVRGEDK
jgi:alpha-D-ribose 1-methylphosphonate 5-triphosphate synthase subunit PhnG